MYLCILDFAFKFMMKRIEVLTRYGNIKGTAELTRGIRRGKYCYFLLLNIGLVLLYLQDI